MDPSSIGAGLTNVREHLPLFLACLAGLPIVSFLTLKLWIAGHASKAQRTTNWFVPTDLESESERMHYNMQKGSVAFASRKRLSRSLAPARSVSTRP